MKKLVTSRAQLLVLVAVGTMVAWLSIAPQAWSSSDLVGGCGWNFRCTGEKIVDCPDICPGPYWQVCEGYAWHGPFIPCTHAEQRHCGNYGGPPEICDNYYDVRCEN